MRDITLFDVRGIFHRVPIPRVHLICVLPIVPFPHYRSFVLLPHSARPRERSLRLQFPQPLRFFVPWCGELIFFSPPFAVQHWIKISASAPRLFFLRIPRFKANLVALSMQEKGEFFFGALSLFPVPTVVWTWWFYRMGTAASLFSFQCSSRRFLPPPPSDDSGIPSQTASPSNPSTPSLPYRFALSRGNDPPRPPLPPRALSACAFPPASAAALLDARAAISQPDQGRLSNSFADPLGSRGFCDAAPSFALCSPVIGVPVDAVHCFLLRACGQRASTRIRLRSPLAWLFFSLLGPPSSPFLCFF